MSDRQIGEWAGKEPNPSRLEKRVLAGSGGAEQERPENVPHASEHSLAWQKCQRSATWHYEDIVFVAREPVTTSHVGGAAKGTAGQRLSAKQREPTRFMFLSAQTHQVFSRMFLYTLLHHRITLITVYEGI